MNRYSILIERNKLVNTFRADPQCIVVDAVLYFECMTYFRVLAKLALADRLEEVFVAVCHMPLGHSSGERFSLRITEKVMGSTGNP